MIYRPLGTTGETVSAIGLGGYHLGKQADPNDSIKIIHTAIDHGITFLDNCWDYNTTASPKSAWARPSATATATRSSS